LSKEKLFQPMCSACPFDINQKGGTKKSKVAQSAQWIMAGTDPQRSHHIRWAT